MDSFDGLSENVVTSPVGWKCKQELCKRDNDKRRQHSGESTLGPSPVYVTNIITFCFICYLLLVISS